MAHISYEQAQSDHKYLWNIGCAYDMTGGYVDQDDLNRMLRNPTKVTAIECYKRQIVYWFQVGTEDGGSAIVEQLLQDDERVAEIYERYV